MLPAEPPTRPVWRRPQPSPCLSGAIAAPKRPEVKPSSRREAGHRLTVSCCRRPEPLSPNPATFPGASPVPSPSGTSSHRGPNRFPSSTPDTAAQLPSCLSLRRHPTQPPLVPDGALVGCVPSGPGLLGHEDWGFPLCCTISQTSGPASCRRLPICRCISEKGHVLLEVPGGKVSLPRPQMPQPGLRVGVGRRRGSTRLALGSELFAQGSDPGFKRRPAPVVLVAQSTGSRRRL